MKPSFHGEHPHHGWPVLKDGEPLERARAAMVMVHGRGSTAQDILSLKDEFGQPGFAYLAPQAEGGTWYPNRFMAPSQQNEPWLSSALAVVGDVISHIVAAGISYKKIMLLGFSQGACLVLEFAARNARRYGGVISLSGALIGPDDMSRSDPRTLDGTPVFLGCSDMDFHIPRRHVDQAAEVLRRLGGEVTERIYPNLGHTVNQDEIEFVRRMMRELS